jgi:hypothetical protein
MLTYPVEPWKITLEAVRWKSQAGGPWNNNSGRSGVHPGQKLAVSVGRSAQIRETGGVAWARQVERNVHYAGEGTCGHDFNSQDCCGEYPSWLVSRKSGLPNLTPSSR